MKLSVVIPANNEEKYIDDTVKSIKSLLSQLNLDYEIIVVDNNSTDNTSKIAKEAGARVVFQPERNIGKTRNAGAKAASNEYLLFLDADSKASTKLIQKSINKIQENKVKAVSAITSYQKYPNIGSYGVWIYNFFSWAFKLGVGQFILVSKDTFDSIGGFDEEFLAYEELDFFKRLKLKFGRNSFVVLCEPIQSSARKFEKGESASKFALQLLVAVFNPKIGKNKDKVSFWYGENKVEKGNKQEQIYSKTKIVFGSLIATLLFFDILFLITNSPLRDFSAITTPIVFVLMLIFLMDSLKNLKYFLIIFFLTIFIEAIGHTYGFPFGFYKYNPEYAQIGLFGVPLYIGIAWYLIVTSAAKLTQNPFYTAFVVLAIDILIEKFATANGLWSWTSPGFLGLEAPLSNYITWFILGFALYFVAKKQDIKKVDAIFTLAVLTIHMLTTYLIITA